LGCDLCETWRLTGAWVFLAACLFGGVLGVWVPGSDRFSWCEKSHKFGVNWLTARFWTVSGMMGWSKTVVVRPDGCWVTGQILLRYEMW
jgi:hypothetical protein